MEAASTWYFYQNAMIPHAFPHESVDAQAVYEGTLWRKNVVLARWTSDFDCGYETSFWYVIKDVPFDLEKLKAKRRYEITKGNRFFNVFHIDPAKYTAPMYRVHMEALAAYPVDNAATPDFDAFSELMRKLSEEMHTQRIYGAFHRESGELCGYIHVPTYESWAALSMMKTVPSMERYGINAAMVYHVLTELAPRLKSGEFYVCDGARSVNHKTNFQQYLEKYFGFRKAYCQLNIVYNPMYAWLVKLLYPFRAMIKKLDSFKLAHKINGVMLMEEVARECKSKKV